jgi:hypothetical protein
MLGGLIFESKGEIISQRVLLVENGIPKLELSVKGIGKFKEGIELTEIWTYWNISRSAGVTYGEGQGVFMTIDGMEVATATGRGIGKLTSLGNVRWVDEILFNYIK